MFTLYSIMIVIFSWFMVDVFQGIKAAFSVLFVVGSNIFNRPRQTWHCSAACNARR